MRHMKRGRRLTISTFDTSFVASTRVLVRPIGLDMVVVGGSNPPDPTNRGRKNTHFLLAGQYSHFPTHSKM